MPYMPLPKILCHLFQVIQIKGIPVPVDKVREFRASISMAYLFSVVLNTYPYVNLFRIRQLHRENNII